jgi:hypothetical protein
MIHASNSLVRWREILERSAGTFQCRAELKSFLLLRFQVLFTGTPSGRISRERGDRPLVT